MSGRPGWPLTVSLAVAALTLGGCREQAAAPAGGRTAVWLDISPAYGDPPRDPGDALALLQAYGSGRLAIRGVSITFGNVPLVRGYPVADELLQRIDTGLLRPWRGASSPEERAAPTEATELLEEALGKEPLTILALGPATTVASVLLRQPELAARMPRIILVGGQHADAASDAPASRTPVVIDPDSLQVLLDSEVPLTLVSASRNTQVGLDAGALARLDEGRGPIGLIVPSARGWLEAVKSRQGRSDFPVPAMIAVDVAAHPGEFRCEGATASLVPGRSGARLVVESGTAGRRVTWCHTADARASQRMLADVLRLQTR